MCNGDGAAAGRKSKYHNHCLDRHRLYGPCDGLYLGTAFRYSYDILKETGEFVINLTTDELVRAADFCGVKSGRDIDKFEACKLTPIPSKEVAVPAIAESPVAIECRVEKCIPLGSHDMFLAKVLAVSIDDSYMDEKGKFHLNKTGIVAYSHGEYFELGKRDGSFGYSVRKKRTKKKEKKK